MAHLNIYDRTTAHTSCKRSHPTIPPHDKTMAYSSEENSIVERCNKEVNRYIRAFTFDKSTQDNYQEHIPFIMRILNTNVNERTKVAPHNSCMVMQLTSTVEY